MLWNRLRIGYIKTTLKLERIEIKVEFFRLEIALLCRQFGL